MNATLSADVALAVAVAVVAPSRMVLVNDVKGELVIEDVLLNCSTVVRVGVPVPEVRDVGAVALVVALAEQRGAYNSVCA